MTPKDWKIGDVVQISPEASNPQFARCLLIVEETRAWGALGYVLHAGPARCYFRLPWEMGERIGRLWWPIDPTNPTPWLNKDTDDTNPTPEPGDSAAK